MCGGVDEGATCEGKGKRTEKEMGERWGRNGGSGGVWGKRARAATKRNEF